MLLLSEYLKSHCFTSLPPTVFSLKSQSIIVTELNNSYHFVRIQNFNPVAIRILNKCQAFHFTCKMKWFSWLKRHFKKPEKFKILFITSNFNLHFNKIHCFVYSFNLKKFCCQCGPNVCFSEWLIIFYTYLESNPNEINCGTGYTF